jgi:hypothetical protein
MTKIQDTLAAHKERLKAAPAGDRAAMQLTGLTSALAQAIADAKMAGLSDAQLMDFQAVQEAMDADLSGGDLAPPAEGRGDHLASPPPMPG